MGERRAEDVARLTYGETRVRQPRASMTGYPT